MEPYSRQVEQYLEKADEHWEKPLLVEGFLDTAVFRLHRAITVVFLKQVMKMTEEGEDLPILT